MKTIVDLSDKGLGLGSDVMNTYASVRIDDFIGKSAFDVFSSNCYGLSPEKLFTVSDIFSDIPQIIGEWHIGVRDKGLLANASVNAATQKEWLSYTLLYINYTKEI